MRRCRHPYFIFFVSVVLFSTEQLFAQTDTTYNRKIKDIQRFQVSSVSVLNLAIDPKIPSPLVFFGEIIGAPGVMHRTGEIYSYYKKLAEASPLISIHLVDTSEEGRPINLVTIGNEDAMKQLDNYKNQLDLLADPRKLEGKDGAR